MVKSTLHSTPKDRRLMASALELWQTNPSSLSAADIPQLLAATDDPAPSLVDSGSFVLPSPKPGAWTGSPRYRRAATVFRVVEDSEIYRRDLDAFGAGVDLFTQTTSGTQDWLALRGTTETALEALTDAPGEGNPYFYLTGVQAKLTYAMHRLLTDHPQRWLRPCAVSSCRGFAVADGRLGQPARYCSDQCRAEGRRSQNARHQAEWRDRDAHKRERLASISLEMTVLKGALLLLEPALARYRNGGDPVTLERWLRTAIGDNVDCQPEAASVEIGRSLDGRVLSISYLTPAHGKHWRALEREAARDFRGDIARVLQLVVMKEVIEYLA